MAANPGRILVFIPMYNCAAQISRVLATFDARAGQVIERVIVVNNRSTDGGEQVAIHAIEQLKGMDGLVLRNDDNYGLGGSHKVAFAHAIENDFDYVVVLHGDDQGRLADMLDFIEAGQHTAVDALLGARFHPDSTLQGYSAFRTFGNGVFNRLFSAVAGMRMHDLGSGLNMYNVELLRDQFYKGFPDDLTFNYCMSLAHAHHRHSVQFIPILWREDDQISNVRLFSQAQRVLKMLGQYSLNSDSFLATDHRLNQREAYTAQVVGSNLDA